MPLSSFGQSMPRSFATTSWSVVLAAGQTRSPEADVALASLCESYWYPLYAFARRSGHRSDDARDLVQAFFAALLEKNYLHSADKERGRFRNFLLTAFRRFISKKRDAQRALKRGGGRTVVSIDTDDAESRYSREPADSLTPDRLFNRRWAVSLLDQVLSRLQKQYEDRGQQLIFETCRNALSGGSDQLRYAESAQCLGMTEGAVKVAVHRMRQRYRDLLVEEVARTVGPSDDTEDEFRQLLAALRAD